MIRLDYTFDASAQTITFTDPVIEEYLGVIVNRANGIIIYNSFSPSTIGTLVGLVLTLAYDTTLMSDGDTLQIFYGDTVKAVTGPLTDTQLRDSDVKVTLDSEQVAISNFPAAVDDTESISLLNKLVEMGINRCPETGNLLTYDTNLSNVFGSTPITSGDSLGAEVKLRRFAKVAGTIIGVNSELKIPCKGANTVAIQLAGTWAGTISFQASVDGGNFIACQAQAIGGGIAVTTTTAAGAWVINCSGFDAVRVVWTTYTSGSAMVFMIADVAAPPAPNVAFPTTQVTTSTNLDASVGAVQLFAPSHIEAKQQIVAPLVNQTMPTTYAANMYARFPQKHRRLRVQSAGDQEVPFAQELYTNRTLVANPEELSLLEQILLQLKMLNQLTFQVNNITPPGGWEEIK